MKDPVNLETGRVLFADLPKDIKEDEVAFVKVIEATIDYYLKLYGTPKRVWVNPKNAPASVTEIKGYKVERRGGCPPGKVMVM